MVDQPHLPDDASSREREAFVRALLEATGGAVMATADEVAAVLRVTTAYVYARSRELGGRRLHAGKRAPLRFNVWTLADRLVADIEEQPSERSRRPRRRRPAAESADGLLPVRDRFAGARPRDEAA
jgi:hypothetical protein